MPEVRVLSSVVERLVYTEDVGGSKPSAPTSFEDRGLEADESQSQ